MKRNIKFSRGKCLDDGSWVYGYCIKYLTGRCFIYEPVISSVSENDMYEYEVDPETVGQFTGLHCKDSREIYEGDILHFTKYGNEYTAAVKWHKEIGAWCLQLNHEPRLGCRPLGDWLLYDSLEIIGNIHDNPELLKEKGD